MPFATKKRVCSDPKFTRAKKNYPSSARLARYIFHVWVALLELKLLVLDTIVTIFYIFNILKLKSWRLDSKIYFFPVLSKCIFFLFFSCAVQISGKWKKQCKSGCIRPPIIQFKNIFFGKHQFTLINHNLCMKTTRFTWFMTKSLRFF